MMRNIDHWENMIAKMEFKMKFQYDSPPQISFLRGQGWKKETNASNEPREPGSSPWQRGPAKDKHRPTPRSADLNLTLFGHKTVENWWKLWKFQALWRCSRICCAVWLNQQNNQSVSSQMMFSYPISHYACFAALAASLSVAWPPFARHLQCHSDHHNQRQAPI